MFEFLTNFIFKRLAINTLSSFAGVGWISSLDDEAFNVAMECCFVVGSDRTKGKKVFGCFGCLLAKEFYFNVSMSCN
jgi:hypothetical protein